MTEYNFSYDQDLRDNRDRDRDDYYRARGYDNYYRDFDTMYGDLPDRDRPSERMDRMEMQVARSARTARYERIYRDSMLVRESHATREFDWYFN